MQIDEIWKEIFITLTEASKNAIVWPEYGLDLRNAGDAKAFAFLSFLRSRLRFSLGSQRDHLEDHAVFYYIYK